MNDKINMSAADRIWCRAGQLYESSRVPFLASMLTGLAAHGYAFANKLVNHDEVESLFGKGATVTSGRWGLELVKVLFPDWSMPWIYGIISLLLISLAVCLMVRMLGIRSPVLQALLGALVVSFPSLTGNFCFMFTSSAYAWAFFLSVLAVYELWLGGGLRACVSVLLLVLALGIYQAYISVAASFCVLLMIVWIMDAERPLKDVILFGVKAVLLMAAAIGLYYAAVQLSFAITGAEFNTYVTENVNADNGFARRIRMAYDAFLYVFTFRNFYIISTETSRVLHIILAGLILVCMGARAYKTGKPLYAAALLVLTALLPLSICCMVLIMSPQSVHSLVMYSFVTVYFLAAAVIERLETKPGRAVCAVAALILSVVVISNVYFSNMCYLKLTMQYENMYAFYSGLITQVEMTEGFDENSSLAIVGQQDNLMHSFPELDTELLMGPPPDLINAYSKENFIRYYLGVDIPFASEETRKELETDPRVEDMAEYPYYGSVRKIDDCIVVKLG